MLWAVQNPDAIDALIDFYNNLPGLNVKMVAPAGIAVAGTKLLITPQNIVLPLPIQLAAGVGNSTATAASVSAQLNLLLAGLRQTGQLPT